jgi:phosphopantothenoylcysteine decarboxylase/phosphopantothenate--cysteine ligase
LNVLITAGGTREPIDPVRYIGNRSSGKQGHALAEEALERGAVVTLVTTAQIPTSDAITTVAVETAQQMHDAVMSRSEVADVIVMAAAVADFAPTQVAPEKLKKRDGTPVLEMHPTVDILAALGSRKPYGQTLVGFAAETNNVRSNAGRKLQEKQVDILVVNDVAAPGVGFEFDTNEVAILSATTQDRFVPLTDKRSVAAEILDAVVSTRSAQVSVPSSGE